MSALIGGAYFYLKQPDIKQVRLIDVQRGDIHSVIRVTGKVINDRTVKMTALTNGQITKMPVRLGDSVQAGQVLTVFDTREADARLGKAEAEYSREKQAVNEYTRTLKRLKKVQSSGGATKQSVEDAQAQLRGSQSRLKVARASLEIEKIHREKIEVTAPFAGVITHKTTEVGQWLEAGTALFTLVAHEGREIEANIDAGDSSTVSVGQAVTLSLDAWPDRQWIEHIRRIAPAISENQDKALNTFAVRISLGVEAPNLLLGQQLDADIQTETRQDVLTLPFEALIESAQGRQLAIVQNDKVKRVSVKTGLEDFTHVEILEGITESSQIILPEGIEFTEGEAVKIITDAP